MEDFEFDDLMGEGNEEFERKIQAMREKMMVQAIEENWQKIEDTNMGRIHLMALDPIQLSDLNLTVKKMIEYFEEEELYERCARLLKLQKDITAIMELDLDPI